MFNSGRIFNISSRNRRHSSSSSGHSDSSGSWVAALRLQRLDGAVLTAARHSSRSNNFSLYLQLYLTSSERWVLLLDSVHG